MSILTLIEAKQHLRYDDSDHDTEIMGFVAAAEQAIKDYTGDSYDGDNPVFKVAAKLLVGWFDENRAPGKDMPTNGNYLPVPVQSLLYKYRTPTVL